jgi:hypothetical protein
MTPVDSCPANPVGCCYVNDSAERTGDVDYVCFYGSSESASTVQSICSMEGETFVTSPPF